MSQYKIPPSVTELCGSGWRKLCLHPKKYNNKNFTSCVRGITFIYPATNLPRSQLLPERRLRFRRHPRRRSPRELFPQSFSPGRPFLFLYLPQLSFFSNGAHPVGAPQELFPPALLLLIFFLLRHLPSSPPGDLLLRRRRAVVGGGGGAARGRRWLCVEVSEGPADRR